MQYWKSTNISSTQIADMYRGVKIIQLLIQCLVNTILSLFKRFCYILYTFCQSINHSRHTSVSFQAHQYAFAHCLDNPGLKYQPQPDCFIFRFLLSNIPLGVLRTVNNHQILRIIFFPWIYRLAFFWIPLRKSYMKGLYCINTIFLKTRRFFTLCREAQFYFYF